MNGLLKKRLIGAIIVIMSFVCVNEVANAASFNDMKENILDGNGILVHPHLYRELTDEEKEEFKDWPEPPTQTNRSMTQEEAAEYVRFVEDYQKKNQTAEVPSEAYDYIQYISEKLVASSSSEITNELRVEAKQFVEEMNSKSQTVDEKTVSKSDGKKKKTKKQKLSLWKRIISFKWFD